MRTGSDLWLILPQSLRRLPADLAGVSLLVVATILSVFVPVVSETPIRIVLGLPFVLFLPGYAFIAALFPERGTLPEEQTSTEEGTTTRFSDFRRGSIDGIERTALSFGLSIAITPLIGLVLNFTPLGIRLEPIVLGIGGFTLVATSVAAVRREALPPEERFRVPFERWYASVRAELFEPATRADRLLNVVLVVSLLLAVSSVTYAVAVPKSGETFTEFYLLTENETGALVAADYPTNFTEGERKSLVVGINNHEQQTVTYSVVVELQRVRMTNNSTTVLERNLLHRFNTRLRENETWTRKHTVSPSITGSHLRLVYLLYRGDPPARPTTENAYRETHLWVNVTSFPP
ncbi:MAG TPA: DUF1616 domain-containing protein [Halococcus sp.]|nr:DUF1616 domain-containing protein [Halococcus sp.]